MARSIALIPDRHVGNDMQSAVLFFSGRNLSLAAGQEGIHRELRQSLSL